MYKGNLFEEFQEDSKWRGHAEAYKRCEILRSKGLITDLIYVG